MQELGYICKYCSKQWGNWSSDSRRELDICPKCLAIPVVDIACQICCRSVGKLINAKFDWLPQLCSTQVAILCNKCEREHGI